VFELTPGFQFSTDRHIVHLDAALTEFPLTIRRWRQGDEFRPLGMNQFKKLSDFFIDEKFSTLLKEQTWILTSNDEIAWVIGHRIDDRFKITSKTSIVMEIILGY